MVRLKKIKSIFNPEQFQGWGKTRRYFEGWYFKVIDPTEKFAFAIIPGMAMDENGKKQAFIQVLDGKKKTAEYHKFEFEEFIPAPGVFKVNIRDNFFSETELTLNFPGLKGKLQFNGNVKWPNSWNSPGIMGPYTFAPFMECYHGIVSMDHEISGELLIGDEAVSFNKGRGYIEKDWGRSFPSAYFWLQSNHFSQSGISLKASVAKIPWVTGSFTGFIAGLWLHDKLYQFTTYNGTKLEKSYADAGKVELQMTNKQFRLHILAQRDHATSLASPIQGFMDGRIEESMTSKVDAQLYDLRTNRIIFEDTGRNAGLEVAGRIEEIIL